MSIANAYNSEKSEGFHQKKRGSLSIKINTGLLAVLIPALVVLIVVSCSMSASAVSNLNNQLIEVQTTNAVNTVDSFFNSKMTAAGIFRYSAVFQNLLTDAHTPQTLAASSKRDAAVNLLNQSYNSMTSDGVQAAWLIGKDNDTYLMHTGEMVAANLQSLSWDDDVLSTKNTVVTEPYLDPVTNKMVVSIVAPVFSANGSDIIGFAGFDVYQDHLSEKLSAITIGKNGTIELITQSNTLAYSFDPNTMNKNVSEVAGLSESYINGVNSGFNGSLTYSYENIPYRSIFRDTSTTGWLAIGSIPETEVNATRNQLILTLVILSIAILVILIMTILTLVRKIMRPLGQITSDVEEFSKGNLHVQIDVSSNDEIGVLADSVRATMHTLQSIISQISSTLSEISNGNLALTVSENFVGDFLPIREALVHIIASLNSTLGQINQSSDQVSGGADQVSTGAQALSQGATEQASSVEELAATITQISEQIKGSAANAEEASQLADSVGQEMTVSNQKMQDMMKAMNEISDRSGEISKIIKTIEDIAFQTNILALNAAVEAARAGAVGKGFAVVADEVKSLAGKSAEASKNTSELIEGSLRAVENGKKIADETAKSLVTAVEGARNVSNTINKISETSKVQANSITQVTQGVDQISSVIQTNSATAEESAAASEELSGQAQTLKNLIGQFRLEM